MFFIFNQHENVSVPHRVVADIEDCRRMIVFFCHSLDIAYEYRNFYLCILL